MSVKNKKLILVFVDATCKISYMVINSTEELKEALLNQLTFAEEASFLFINGEVVETVVTTPTLQLKDSSGSTKIALTEFLQGESERSVADILQALYSAGIAEDPTEPTGSA